MKTTVSLLPSNTTKTVNIKTGATLMDLLKQLHLKPDSSIVLQGETPIPIDDDVADGKKYKIIQVASGG